MALPPRYQNLKDLKVMVEFIENYPLVAGGLQSINLETLTIHFGEGGIARFGRQVVKRETGWVGPAAPLEFKSCNCDIE